MGSQINRMITKLGEDGKRNAEVNKQRKRERQRLLSIKERQKDLINALDEAMNLDEIDDIHTATEDDLQKVLEKLKEKGYRSLSFVEFKDGSEEAPRVFLLTTLEMIIEELDELEVSSGYLAYPHPWRDSIQTNPDIFASYVKTYALGLCGGVIEGLENPSDGWTIPFHPARVPVAIEVEPDTWCEGFRLMFESIYKGDITLSYSREDIEKSQQGSEGEV